MTAGPLREHFGLPLKGAQLLHNAVLPTTYARGREPLLTRGYARQISAVADRVQPDIVLAPGTIPVAHLGLDVPVVTWTDATFAGMVDFYPSFTGLSRRTLRLGHAVERAALGRASLALYSSDWAAESAISAYGVARHSVGVIPFGANSVDPGAVGTPASEVCRLLIVGRDWHRKGVDIAVSTLERLRESGVAASLDIVGCSPPPGTELPPGVTVHHSLDKNDPRAVEELAGLYRDATFFLLPTRADCTPIVLAEAQAYGLPVLVSGVGGCPSMVRRGQSGEVFELSEFAARAAGYIAGVRASAGRYAELRAGARAMYEESLNWSSSVRRLLDLVHERCLSGSR
jgi:glycosyltransferase involved in cell wall biosynthesis